VWLCGGSKPPPAREGASPSPPLGSWTSAEERENVTGGGSAGSQASLTGSAQTSPVTSFAQASHQRPHRSEAGRRGTRRQTSQTAAITTAPWREARTSGLTIEDARMSIAHSSFRLDLSRATSSSSSESSDSETSAVSVR